MGGQDHTLMGDCLGMNSLGLYLNINLLRIPEMDFGREGLIISLCLPNVVNIE